jgi:hypothetical protein
MIECTDPVCAGGAENIPPAPITEFGPAGVGIAYDTAVLTGENKDACGGGGVGVGCKHSIQNGSKVSTCKFLHFQ